MEKNKKEFYIPSLDGLRAIAVLIVFISHAGWGSVIPGGFGVTIFFFLSGYLISTLLKMEYRETGKIRFKDFYLRRAYRILPPMYVVLLVGFILWCIGLTSGTVSIWGVFSQIFQTTNYYLLYSNEKGIIPYTGILWSLSVEEHFYLVFPLFFAFFASKFSDKKVSSILVVIVVMILLWRFYLFVGLNASDERIYSATDTRVDSILFGCVMGIFTNSESLEKEDKSGLNFFQIFLLCLSFSILLFTFFYRDAMFRQTLRYSLQGIALYSIFFLAIRKPNWLFFKVLNWNFMRFFGKISYSFYLCHFLIINIILSLPIGKLEMASLSFLISFSFSLVLYFFIEKPFIKLRRRLHSNDSVVITKNLAPT